jgi:hypothetical protein
MIFCCDQISSAVLSFLPLAAVLICFILVFSTFFRLFSLLVNQKRNNVVSIDAKRILNGIYFSLAYWIRTFNA